MRPEEIQNHDFLVGLRGYDKDEVRAFLAEVAAEHASLLAAVEQGQASAAAAAAAPAPARAEGNDDFENLGASVAAILRTAKESARDIAGEAEARATALREEAEQLHREARESAQAVREQAAAETEGMREQAQQLVADARNEADRIMREASERVRQIEVEHEARMNNKAEEVARREQAMRQRLLEAADELQLALVALSDEGQPVEANHQEDQEPALG